MLVTSWGLYRPILSHDNIRQESTIISGCWKWLGASTGQFAAVNVNRPLNDKPVVKALHTTLSKADVLVGHNGDRFDLRKFNARAIYHGLDPLPPVRTVDTLKVARKLFYFNSNRLDYLGKFLCGTGKIPTTYDLWLKILEGDESALEEMIRYNLMDVEVLEKVYLRLRPYITNHPNAAVYTEVKCCAMCGSEEFIRRGFKYQQVTKRQQYQCKACGGYFCGPYEKVVLQ